MAEDKKDDLSPSEEAELRVMDEEAQRIKGESDVEMAMYEGVRGVSDSPVDPVKLEDSDSFCFNCHKGVSCWNECCHGADITLTPYDILRLARSLNMTPSDFLVAHTVPAIHDTSDLPIAKLKMGGADGKGACAFVADEGCTVYENRPATCRYYPLGLMSVKLKGGEAKEDFHFIVREDHCQGHKESKEQSVADFRKEQGVGAFDRVNRGWIDILMKMASWKGLGGPQGKDVSIQVKQMFFMVATDIDKFRQFVFDSKFLETYMIDDETIETLKIDDAALLQLGLDWLKNVMFNEPTISLREDVMRGAIAKARKDFTTGT